MTIYWSVLETWSMKSLMTLWNLLPLYPSPSGFLANSTKFSTVCKWSGEDNWHAEMLASIPLEQSCRKVQSRFSQPPLPRLWCQTRPCVSPWGPSWPPPPRLCQAGQSPGSVWRRSQLPETQRPLKLPQKGWKFWVGWIVLFLVHLRFSKFCSSIAFTEILTEWKINQFKTYLHYWVLSKQLQYWEGQSGGAATERGGWWLRPMRGGLAFLCQPIGRVYFWADLLLVHVPGSATHERINYGQHVSLDEMSG